MSSAGSIDRITIVNGKPNLFIDYLL